MLKGRMMQSPAPSAPPPSRPINFEPARTYSEGKSEATSFGFLTWLKMKINLRQVLNPRRLLTPLQRSGMKSSGRIICMGTSSSGALGRERPDGGKSSRWDWLCGLKRCRMS